MRLIPGKTKVQIELFKGVSLWDVLIGGIAVAMILLLLLSSMPFKLGISIGIFVVAAMLLIRLDTEPTYMTVLNVIKHLAYPRRFEKVYDDEMILKKNDGTAKEEFLEEYREKNQIQRETLAGTAESAEADECLSGEAKFATEEILSEKELIKRENKILKSKTATPEEKDAVWLARAQRSAAKKEAKKQKKQGGATGQPKVAEQLKTAGQSKTDKQSKAAKPQLPGVPEGMTEKELIKQENKILKSKTATDEEKNAVWLARAQRSAAKKEAKKEAQKKARQRASKNQKDYSNFTFMEDVMAFTGIKDDFIEYGGKYYGTVIEIDPVEFRFFSTHRRNNSIELGLGRVLRSIHLGFAANIVKLERPIIYDAYLKKEEEKLEQIRKSYESGMMSEEELQARVEIENDRLAELKGLCTDKQVVAPFYYLVLFESDKKQLEIQTQDALDSLGKGEMTVRRLNTKELAVFLKYTNELDFDEREIEKYQPEDYTQWAMPQSVHVKYRTVEVNDIVTHNFRVVKYPSWVGDAWLANVLSMPATKVVIKCSPMDRGKAIRTIDRSLQELRGQYNATGVDSKRIELENHINTLGDLLATLQGEGEELLECNIYVTAYDVQTTRMTKGLDELQTLLPEISSMKKTVRRGWQENNFRLNDNFFNQMNAFVGSQISAYDPESKNGRGIPSNSLAACYPWVYAHISDEGGFKLGSSEGVPVFIDFFRRDSERVNSNMVIIGKSGSGKSYATKSILSNLASEDAKIFILDPENEYSELAHNLHGKVINVANAQYGRLNPFHIITALDDDEGGSATGSFSTHLQFLEEFYRQILPEIEKDALEYLNNLTERLYTNRGITPDTDLSRLRPEDYPIFDDLYDAVLEEFERTDNEYIRSMLRTLINYVAKFSTGGRNANIWNGPSTVTTEENFTVFNFQAMLSNRNTTIANAQMLLVLKYIDNEIIKNRDYNTKYGLKRKIVVVIDEAHVFIDAKFPIALDFMFQLAKRIRKYNGMQIVITQNIKDFVGSEEIARKSTAIINACQYSFIFALAPNDMHDLCTLYEKAGGISELEQEKIIQAPRGQAFTVMSATSRSTFKVEVPKNMVDMFQEQDFQSRYYTGTDGAAAWESFVGPSRAAHDANYKFNKKAEIVNLEEAKEKKSSWVNFWETEEEVAEELNAKAPSEGQREENLAEETGEMAKHSARTSRISFEELQEPAVSEEQAQQMSELQETEDEDFDLSDEAMDALIKQRLAEKHAEREAALPQQTTLAEEGHRPATPVKAAASDSTEVIGQLKDVLAEFVQAVKQPVPVPVPVAPQAIAPMQEQQTVDVEALVADVRRQVMAQVMEELQTGDLLPTQEWQSSSAYEQDTEQLEDSDQSEYGYDALEDIEDPDELDEQLESMLDRDLELDPEADEELTEPIESDFEEDEEASDDFDEAEELDDDFVFEDEEDEDDEADQYDFSSLFEDEPDETSDEFEDDAEEETGGFDVMKLLRKEAETLSEQKKAREDIEVEISDYAQEGGIADISLEDLALIVSAQRKKRRK